jgi:hypothetical protein
MAVLEGLHRGGTTVLQLQLPVAALICSRNWTTVACFPGCHTREACSGTEGGVTGLAVNSWV